MDLTLTNFNNTYAFLDDFLIVTKGTLVTHRQELHTVHTRLDEEKLAISLDKSKFACKYVERIGYTINNEGTKPLTKKTEATEKLSPTKRLNIKKFHGFNTASYKIHIKISTNSGSTAATFKNAKKNRPIN